MNHTVADQNFLYDGKEQFSEICVAYTYHVFVANQDSSQLLSFIRDSYRFANFRIVMS